MFKVSFSKVYVDDPVKVKVFNKTLTKVTLQGYVKEIDFNRGVIADNTYRKLLSKDYPAKMFYSGYIHAIGVSKKNESDEYDEVLGYRIAESRAKIKIYKTMYKFTKSLLSSLRSYCFADRAMVPSKPDSDCLIITVGKYKALLDKEQIHLNTLIHGIDTKSSQQS